MQTLPLCPFSVKNIMGPSDPSSIRTGTCVQGSPESVQGSPEMDSLRGTTCVCWLNRSLEIQGDEDQAD